VEELLIPAAQALEWLHSDLASLGPDWIRDGAFEQAPQLACLLCAVLAPRVGAALALQDGCGTKFLRSAGTEPGREWVDFRRRLDGMEVSSSLLAVNVDAAK
jgi:hypothetical protein